MGKMQVTAKQVYGETKFYPADEIAMAYAVALGTKTLTRHALVQARKMGFEIVLDGDQTLTKLLASVAQ